MQEEIKHLNRIIDDLEYDFDILYKVAYNYIKILDDPTSDYCDIEKIRDLLRKAVNAVQRRK